MSTPPSKPGGKKSHACGPCRRLKRKCDLQIPCGTCTSGRNTKIDECLANPARPLSNVQELIAPNLKFGRVPKRSPPSNSDSNAASPNVLKKQKSMVNINNSDTKRMNPKIEDSTGNFSQFDYKKTQGTSQDQNSRQSQSSLTEGSQLSIESTMPGVNNNQSFPQSQNITPTSSSFENPQFSMARPQSSNVPVQQFQYHQQLPINMAHHSPYGSIAYSQPSPLSQHQQQPIQPLQHSPMVHGHQAPASQSMFFDQNELLKKQLEAQFHRIQQLEIENTQQKSQVQELQNLVSAVRSPTSIPTPPSADQKSRSKKNDYKAKFLNLLPSQIQTTVLVNFYLQNIDYIYHPLHHPSFRLECEQFYKNQEDVDIGWLAVLFMVLALAAIHLPKGLINITSQEIEKSHKIWFEASRKCIGIWDSLQKDETKFNIYTLQCFSLCQLYMYATKRAEALNEVLEKAIHDALKMGLDKDDSENPNLLEVQMKRRLWWDICGCDTFRSLSLGVKPLIRSYSNSVPLPANANDDDITPNAIKIRSSNVATDNSFNIYRAQMMKILNGVYEKEHEVRENYKDLKSNLEKVEDSLFKGLIEIDIELCDSSKGWYFQIDKFGNLPSISEPKIQFQHHMLHTCICIHRFRIYQNYLQNDIPIAWEVGVTSARALFAVYKRLRKIYDLKNPLFLSQIHQSFTGSIIQSMLLLLNRKISLEDQSALYEDIDWMLKDLEILGRDVFIMKPEVLKESFKVLNALKKSINKNLVELEKDQKDIVSNVFGGKDMTENYLQKCTVSFIIDKVDRRASNEPPAAENSTFDYQNQLGTLVTSDLIKRSVEKFDEIRHGLKNEDVTLTQDSVEKQLMLMRAQAGQSKQQETQQTKEYQEQPIVNTQSSSESFPISQSAAQPDNSVPPTTRDGFVRQPTPIEINLNGIDSFWNDVGPQGIDELSNMYYSEFSGYRIA